MSVVRNSSRGASIDVNSSCVFILMLKKPYIIPAKPEILASLTAQLNSDQPDLDSVVKTLKSDASLYALILSIVNKPLFSGAAQITTLEQAVMRLGFYRLDTLVKLTVLKKSLSGPMRLDRFWDTATEVGELASTLANSFAAVNVDDAYTVGMLHDCGIPLMLEQFPDFSSLLKSQKLDSTQALIQAEISQYGVDHFSIGAEITANWQLPEVISETINLQKQYPVNFLNMDSTVSRESKRLCCMVLLAKDISRRYRHFWRIDQAADNSENLRYALEYLGISEVDYWDLRDDLLLELEQLS